MADRIIYNLDANGYLQGAAGRPDRSRRPAPSNWRWPSRRWRSCRSSIRRASAARDLRECLLLAIDAGHATATSSCKTLISSHLEDLEHNRLPVIERKTGYSIELIQETLVELRKLNPKPGADFGDVFVPDRHARRVRRVGRRRQIQGAAGRRPHAEALHQPLLIASILMSDKANAETREYIKRKINSAQWLIESIEQRRNTLTRVAQAIVDHQTEFLEQGPRSRSSP